MPGASGDGRDEGSSDRDRSMWLARDELVQHDAERVHVRAFRERLPCHLLGRHVSSRPDHRVRSSVAGRHGDPEVGDPDPSVLIDQDIGGLEVAMQHALGMGRRQPGTQLVGDFDARVRTSGGPCA